MTDYKLITAFATLVLVSVIVGFFMGQKSGGVAPLGVVYGNVTTTIPTTTTITTTTTTIPTTLCLGFLNTPACDPIIRNLTGSFPGEVILCTGDVDNDCKVDMRDIATVAKSYGTYAGTPGYNLFIDINCDGKIDIRDIATAAHNFGKIC